MKGAYIVFEGIDSNGKSTQIKLVEKELSKKHKVFMTQEPGGTGLGKKIRKLLLDNKSRMSDKTEKYFYLANRSDVVDNVRDYVKRGYIALSSRCFLSTEAYQGYAGGENLNGIRKMNKEATGGCNPDLVIIYDLDMKTALKRKARQKSGNIDRFERKKLAYHEKVRRGYHRIASYYKEKINIKIIDITGKSIKQVFYETMSLINELINNKSR